MESARGTDLCDFFYVPPDASSFLIAFHLWEEGSNLASMSTSPGGKSREKGFDLVDLLATRSSE